MFIISFYEMNTFRFCFCFKYFAVVSVVVKIVNSRGVLFGKGAGQTVIDISQTVSAELWCSLLTDGSCQNPRSAVHSLRRKEFGVKMEGLKEPVVYKQSVHRGFIQKRGKLTSAKSTCDFECVLKSTNYFCLFSICMHIVIFISLLQTAIEIFLKQLLLLYIYVFTD